MSAAARKIASLEAQLRNCIALMWVAANKAGGEIHITNEELAAMPRGAQLEQRKTSVGIKFIATDPWKREVAFDLDVTKVTEAALSVGKSETVQAAFEAITGETQTAE